MGTSSLVIRRRKDGSTTFDKALPDRHTFGARFIAREIQTGLVEVTITVRPSDGEPAVYRLTGFEPVDEAGERLNWSAWECGRIDGTDAAPVAGESEPTSEPTLLGG